MHGHIQPPLVHLADAPLYSLTIAKWTERSTPIFRASPLLFTAFAHGVCQAILKHL